MDGPSKSETVEKMATFHSTTLDTTMFQVEMYWNGNIMETPGLTQGLRVKGTKDLAVSRTKDLGLRTWQFQEEIGLTLIKMETFVYKAKY